MHPWVYAIKHLCIYVSMHLWTHSFMYICVCASMHICRCVYVPRCVCVSMYPRIDVRNAEKAPSHLARSTLEIRGLREALEDARTSSGCSSGWRPHLRQRSGRRRRRLPSCCRAQRKPKACGRPWSAQGTTQSARIAHASCRSAHGGRSKARLQRSVVLPLSPSGRWAPINKSPTRPSWPC